MNLLVVGSLHLNSLVTKQFATKLHVQNLSHIKVFLPFSFEKYIRKVFASHFHYQKMGHPG